MTEKTAPSEALAAVVGPRVLARGLGAPLRAWSLAVSFLGDCIVPRGGDVGTATLVEALAALRGRAELGEALWRCRTCGEPFDHFKCV